MSFSTVTAERYHDISCGHRVVGHENRCRHLHGHNYRIHFRVGLGRDSNEVDNIGRVMDFSVIKSRLCMWLEDEWDHKMLLWKEDPILPYFGSLWIDGVGLDICQGSIVVLPFNPTAENMAKYLIEVIAPKQLEGTGVVLLSCTVEETRKCSATFEIEK
jgi:6-pyruvoyltetrahydropterin/6-carboxytetrahydropterin synthase